MSATRAEIATDLKRVAPPQEATRREKVARLLSAVLAVDTVVASLIMLLVPSTLLGPAAMNGSARGTALVALVLGVPTLVGSLVMRSRGSERAVVFLVGSLAYFAYNGVMFLLATPYNRLFPLYVVMLAVALWALIALLTEVSSPALPPDRGLRAVAAYMGLIVVLNTFAWLATIVPDLLDDSPGTFLEGMGVATNPVFVQDLTFWLPAMGLAAWLLWSGAGNGWLLAGGALIYWQIEGIGVAVDQWWGHHADPASDVVNVAAVPMFLVLFVVGLLPCWALLHRGPGPSGLSTRDH